MSKNGSSIVTWCCRALSVAAYLGIGQLMFATNAWAWGGGIPGTLSFAVLPASGAALFAVVGERRLVQDERVFVPALLVVVLAAAVSILGHVPPVPELGFVGFFMLAMQTAIAVPLVLLAICLVRWLRPRRTAMPRTTGADPVSPFPIWQLGAIATYLVSHLLLGHVLPTSSDLVPTFGAAAMQLIAPAACAGIVAIAGSLRLGLRPLSAVPNALFCVTVGAIAAVAAHSLQLRLLERLAAFPVVLGWGVLAVGLQVLIAVPLLLALDLMLRPRTTVPAPS